MRLWRLAISWRGWFRLFFAKHLAILLARFLQDLFPAEIGVPRTLFQEANVGDVIEHIVE